MYSRGADLPNFNSEIVVYFVMQYFIMKYHIPGITVFTLREIFVTTIS